VNAVVPPVKNSEIYLEHTKWRRDLINGEYNIKKEDAAMVTKNPNCCISDFNVEADMLEWAGISFGPQDTYAMQHSLKKLACISGASKVKFAGKILGSEKDYWIACGELKEKSEYEAGCEPRGVGCNACVFWVTDNLLHDWIQLPDVKPKHIIATRSVKKILSGNLNASIQTNPPFPGAERHYLRAILARIFHATQIAPKGLYEMAGEEGEA